MQIKKPTISTVQSLIRKRVRNARSSRDLPIDHSRDLYAPLIDQKLRLEPFIPHHTNSLQSAFRRPFKHHPPLHVRRAVPTHVSYPTPATVFSDGKIGFRSGEPVPFGFEAAIALHEIVQAEPRGPASGATVWAAAAELFQDGDLSVLQDEIAIGQKTVGALRARVYEIVWIGEIFECYGGNRFVWWKR